MISSLLSVLLATGTGTGERVLPRIALVGFVGTEARSLDDYLGQVLLVDFFAHWCAPCARQVPHLNELAEAYREQGLNLLAVTGDDTETAAEWLARFEARYAHARDSDLALQIELGFRPLPCAVLVDATGVIVWQGNPADLPMERIEGLLEGALSQPAHGWPAGAASVREALRNGRYEEAETGARALAGSGAEIARFVGRFVERRVELMEDALAREDYLTANTLATELEAGLADGGTRGRAVAVRSGIAADERARALLAAQVELRELWSSVGSVASVAQADELGAKIRALSDAHGETQVERTASVHLETIAALKSVLR